MEVKVFSFYMEKNKFVFIFTWYHLLPLATGKDYSSISKIGQQNPGIAALEYFISAYVEAYQNIIFQLTSSVESKDISA